MNYALAKRGGIHLGRKPSTQIVYLNGQRVKSGEYEGYLKGYIYNMASSKWSKHPRPIHPRSILKRFYRFPTSKQLKIVRASLQVETLQTLANDPQRSNNNHQK